PVGVRDLSHLRIEEPNGGSASSPRAMRQKPTLSESLLDLLVPIGAVLVFCFSLGSIFFHEGGLHLSRPPPPHVLKAYRKDAAAAAVDQGVGSGEAYRKR